MSSEIERIAAARQRCMAMPSRFGMVAAITTLALSAASAAGVPIGGPYGTVAICIIDTITDSPMPVVQFNAAGAPLGRVTTEGLETASDACSLGRILKHEGSGAVQSWSVQARCTDRKGPHEQVLTVSRDADRSVTVTAADGRTLITADLCSAPYAERAAKELGRMTSGDPGMSSSPPSGGE